MFHLSILFSILFFSALEAKLEDHFKPALNKKGSHQIPGIDFIYTINLDQRPEKFAHCLEELKPFSIEPYRFSAVNGWELSLETINDVGVVYDRSMQGGKWGTSFLSEYNGQPYHSIIDTPGRTYFGHCSSRGVIGILLSHLSILQDAYNSGYRTVWVMEDDVEIEKDPRILSDLIEELDVTVGPGGWDILFTDRDTKDQNGNYVQCRGCAWRPNFTPTGTDRFAERTQVGSFIKTGARYGAYSMIVRKSGMEKLLNYFKKYKLFLPYDMEFYLPSNIQMYTVSEDVVSTQPRALSDNGAPNFLNKPN